MTQQLGAYTGRIANPHILYGQRDLENAPTTFARYATRWGDVQLSNGWMNTNFGRRLSNAKTGYLSNVQPTVPGQTRLTGLHPSNYPMRGPAPSQWQFHVNNGPGSQPDYPGGPGQILGGGPILQYGSGG